jgi:hypothetical protein
MCREVLLLPTLVERHRTNKRERFARRLWGVGGDGGNAGDVCCSSLDSVCLVTRLRSAAPA